MFECNNVFKMFLDKGFMDNEKNYNVNMIKKFLSALHVNLDGWPAPLRIQLEPFPSGVKRRIRHRMKEYRKNLPENILPFYEEVLANGDLSLEERSIVEGTWGLKYSKLSIDSKKCYRICKRLARTKGVKRVLESID